MDRLWGYSSARDGGDDGRFQLPRDVEMRSIQLSQAFVFPRIFRLIENGELVPTLESPYLRSMAGISTASSDVTSCWYVFDMPNTMVAAMLMKR